MNITSPAAHHRENVSNEHYITCGPPQREEVLGEILIIYRGVFY